MKIPRLHPFRYQSKVMSLGCSLLVSVLLLLYIEKWSLFVHLKASLIACAFSTLTAFLLIRLVILLSRYLDFHYPWKRSFSKRWLRQLLLAWFFPLLLAVLFAGLYFAFFKINILQTNYFKRYLFIIALWLIILNALLFYQQQKQQQKQNKMFFLDQKALKDFKFPIEISAIALIELKDKNYFIIDFKGEALYWQHSLQKTMSLLPADQFYLANRNFIINRKALSEVITFKNKLQLKLLPELNRADIIISRREKAHFKAWI